MKARNHLIPLLALTATLAAPLAFAQSTPQTAEPQTTPTDAAAAPAATPAEPAQSQAKGKTWADVDSDKDGKISKTESATEPAVGQIFDQADSNKDGSLTTDEYKAYIAKANGGSKGKSGG